MKETTPPPRLNTRGYFRATVAPENMDAHVVAFFVARVRQADLVIPSACMSARTANTTWYRGHPPVWLVMEEVQEAFDQTALFDLGYPSWPSREDVALAWSGFDAGQANLLRLLMPPGAQDI